MKLQLLSIALVAGAFFASCGGDATTTENADNANANKVAETTPAPATETTYAVNTDQSSVRWRGTMLGVKSHHGTAKFTDGTVTVAAGQLVGGNFTVDLNSIAAWDSTYDKTYTKEKLIGHLKSPDFFDTQNHPSAKLRILEAKGNTATAELTIRGITNTETIENIQITETNGELKATGDLNFDRQKYEVKWSSGAQEMVLADEIKLNIELVGRAQAL